MTTENGNPEQAAAGKQLAHGVQPKQVAQHTDSEVVEAAGRSDLELCPFCGCSMRIETSAAWHQLTGDHDDRCLFDTGEFAYIFHYPATDSNLVYMKTVWNRRHTLGGQVASVAQSEQVAYELPELDAHDLSAQRYWADQAAQGKPYESQLREACERNGIHHGLDDGEDKDA